MDKKIEELIEDFFDNRTFQIKVEQLNVARVELKRLIHSALEEERKRITLTKKDVIGQ
jgi:hypothetical protein